MFVTFGVGTMLHEDKSNEKETSTLISLQIRVVTFSSVMAFRFKNYCEAIHLIVCVRAISFSWVCHTLYNIYIYILYLMSPNVILSRSILIVNRSCSITNTKCKPNIVCHSSSKKTTICIYNFTLTITY